MTHATRALFVLLFGAASVLHAEELRLAGLFTDHVVLQRDRPAPVWGWAAPGDEVTVEFAGQLMTTMAGPTGKWLVTTDAMPASSEGRRLVVRSAAGGRGATISDVLVGDVWLCSGQSNMAFPMSRAANSRDEVAAADHPTLRFFKVEDHFAQSPAADVGGAWKPVSPATASDCSAVAYYFGRELLRTQNVPIGLLVSSVGGTRIETWMPTGTLARIGVAEGLVAKWKGVPADEFARIVSDYKAYQNEVYHEHPQAVRAARERGEPVPPAPRAPSWRGHDCPGALHNGMIAPLRPYSIRGVTWYQGESNVGNPAAYERTMPALIADWRRRWGDELPFLLVQLAPHKSVTPGFREAQHRVWKTTPNTAMVVTTDVGNAHNIHPEQKRPVGERLALAARAIAYGEDIESSGPIFEGVKFDGGQAVVSFAHTGRGLVASGGELTGFTIATADGLFEAACAEIDGTRVRVYSEKGAPVAVRYAWAKVPKANLFNSDGLPAAPFRSDTPSRRGASRSR